MDKNDLKTLTDKQIQQHLLHVLMDMQQRFGKKCDCEHSTLICLRHGTIKGSEVCLTCKGLIGRDNIQ